MNLEELAKKAREKLRELTGYKEGMVTGVAKSEGEYLVTVEVVERKGIPDTMDHLAEYEVHMSEDGQLLSYSRIRMRKRGDVSSYLAE